MSANATRAANEPRSKDFTGSALRLLRRLAPQRPQAIAVLTMSVCGVALSVIGPRVLGHATDLLFDGVIGRRLPAGLTKAGLPVGIELDGPTGSDSRLLAIGSLIQKSLPPIPFSKVDGM